MSSKQAIVDALRQGNILSIEWTPIQEMLGECPERILSCVIYQNTGNFVPTVLQELEVSEACITEALNEAVPKWMSEDYPPEPGLLGHAVRRLVAIERPQHHWLERP